MGLLWEPFFCLLQLDVGLWESVEPKFLTPTTKWNADLGEEEKFGFEHADFEVPLGNKNGSSRK